MKKLTDAGLAEAIRGACAYADKKEPNPARNIPAMVAFLSGNIQSMAPLSAAALAEVLGVPARPAK